jgi:hypothetical protein
MGASLRSLFALPEDYEGRPEEDNDEKLVTRYAEGKNLLSWIYNHFLLVQKIYHYLPHLISHHYPPLLNFNNAPTPLTTLSF